MHGEGERQRIDGRGLSSGAYSLGTRPFIELPGRYCESFPELLGETTYGLALSWPRGWRNLKMRCLHCRLRASPCVEDEELQRYLKNFGFAL